MLNMKEKIKSIGIGFGSALIESLCCVGPLFLVFLGISTVSTAIGIGYYKLYFSPWGSYFLSPVLLITSKRKRL